MMAKNFLPLLLLQCVINIAIFDAAKDASFTRLAYFKTLRNKRLLGHVVERFEAPSLTSCSHSCLRKTWCTSTNFKLFSENNNKGICELNKFTRYPLDVDSTDLNDQHGVIFSMIFKSPCEYSPCRNDALCLPLYRSNSYYCMLTPAGKIEQGAPWSKLNSDEVCFGAENDSYGKFNITSSGIIIALKLVYISGFVTCNNKNVPYGSHWNCKKGSNIGTIVTNANNEVIFPHNYQKKVYNLPGYHENSSELVFSGQFPPVIVAAGDQYRIWYHEDFVNEEEDNNDGQTCVDVFALFMW